jgi:hypothetical protein
MQEKLGGRVLLTLALLASLLAFRTGLGAAQEAPDPLEALMQLAAESAPMESSSPRTHADLMARCAEHLRAAQSHRSWLIQRDFSMDYLKPRNYAYVEWRVASAGPGRRSVRQTIHEKPPLGEMLDERISIEPDHFVRAGSWMRAPREMVPDYAELDRFLGPAKFAAILRDGRASGAGTANAAGRRFVVVEYDNVRLEEYQILAGLKGIRPRARLWIDAETGHLAKGELIFRGKDSGDREVHKVFEQVFADYNADISVEAPSLAPTRK